MTCNRSPALRLVLCLFTALLAGGCATRGPEVLQPAGSVPGAKLVTLYVATTRQRAAPGSNDFTTGRADALNYARYTVSIPPTHRPTRIEWPRGKPDPRTDFAIVEDEPLSKAEFQSAVARAAAADDTGRGADAGVFVHGYNNSFAESLFRLAEISADARIEVVPVLFAWPSEGSVAGYVADKEAATYSRGYLADLLATLTRTPHVGQVSVVGHSMGAWLELEALRQLRLSGQDRVLRRLGRVILAAPDVETAVFRDELQVIGPLDPPMTVFVSRTDHVLQLAQRVAQGRPRAGDLDVDDPKVQALARKLHIRIVDISDLPAQDPLHHDQFLSLVNLYPRVGPDGPEAIAGNLQQAGAFAVNAVGATLRAPFVAAAR